MMHCRRTCGKAQGTVVRTKTVKMTFKREELLYDIRNNAYVEGDVMQVKTEHDRHQVQDIGEDGNIDRVTRVLDLAHAECEEALFPYTKENLEQETEMDDTPTYIEPTADAEGTVEKPVETPAEGETDGETSGTVTEEDKPSVLSDDEAEDEFTDETPKEKPTGDYVIRLLVPDEYSKTTVRLIVRYIHEYMVCRVLADWLSITNPPSAANWKAKQDEALEGMKEAVNFRTGRVRRTQTPL